MNDLGIIMHFTFYALRNAGLSLGLGGRVGSCVGLPGLRFWH